MRISRTAAKKAEVQSTQKRTKREARQRTALHPGRQIALAMAAVSAVLFSILCPAASVSSPGASRVEAAAVAPYTYGVTIDEYLGCTRYPDEFLAEHFYDGYYLGTPYRGLGPATWANPLSISLFNGDIGGIGACNCAGVPSALMRNCGGDLSRIARRGSGAYTNATNWLYTATHSGILTYHFNTMEEALDSGVVRRGDLFYLDPITWELPGIDCHIGVFWGNDPRHNMGIHSVPPDVQYSPIAADPAAFTVYVFPTRHADLKGYADPQMLTGTFDAFWYYIGNPDVAAAFGFNEPMLYYHYTNCGIYENRRASLVYDPVYYRAHNPAIAQQTDGRDVTYLVVFQLFGMENGDRGCAEFDPVYYRAHNPDLEAAFGDHWRSYYEHYIRFGVWEGRAGSDGAESLNAGTGGGTGVSARGSRWEECGVFDAQYYLNRYADLRAAFGNDEAAALRHFEEYGMREGRVASAGFDVQAYRARHADLEAAFGNDWAQYYQHYLDYGLAEGRNAAP